MFESAETEKEERREVRQSMNAVRKMQCSVSITALVLRIISLTCQKCNNVGGISVSDYLENLVSFKEI